MGKPGTLDDQDGEIIEKYVKDPLTIKRLYNQDAVLKHLKSDLKIMVEAQDLQKQQRGDYSFIDGKAVLMNAAYSYNGKIEVKCRIACGKLYLLKDRIN